MQQSPNVNIEPFGTTTNNKNHLVIGGLDAVELVNQFGTPLWIIDEETIKQCVKAVCTGLETYPNSLVLYAGKANLCLAICHLMKELKLGLDVVSGGELYTAIKANFSPELIYMHGNNKSEEEICVALSYGNVKIVVDNESELHMVAQCANKLKTKASILFRIAPGVVPDTHQYIATGHLDSKFGVPISNLEAVIKIAYQYKNTIELLGIHTHIGSQSHDFMPYSETIEILANFFASFKKQMGFELKELDLGGGLGIAYNEDDCPMPIYDWSKQIAETTIAAFKKRDLSLPKLLIEPGRSLIGTAGITLYKVGHIKIQEGVYHYLAIDGGMADNPRPITYQAKYTACIANNVKQTKPKHPVTIVGKYCESGDIIINDTYISAQTGDILAVFGTGAYNYSMASNYNRTGRPACILIANNQAEIIIERESNEDLIKQDRLPKRFLNGYTS